MSSATLDRRRVIQAGLALAGGVVLAPLGRTAERSQPAWPSATSFDRVIVDERFESSRIFADALPRATASPSVMRGDITEIWYRDLHSLWKRQPVAIAGLTTAAPLFCLERLAWDVGLRVIFRARHYHAPDGRLQHDLEAASAIVSLQAEKANRAASWPQFFAALAALAPDERRTRRSQTARIERFAAPAAATGPNEPADLFSWVIAPARSAGRSPRAA